MGRVRGVFVALALALMLPASAHAFIALTADSTSDKDYIRVGILGSMSLTDLHVGEMVDGAYVEIAPLTLEYFGTYDGYGDLGRTTIARAARWRCDRLNRTFLAYGTDTFGQREESDFLVRTESCANRMRMSVPLRAARHKPVTVKLTDTFHVGAVGGKLCRTPPGGTTRCQQFRVPTGRISATTKLTLPKDGHWRITLRSPEQTIQRTVAVGVKPRASDLAGRPEILTTGDSLMQGLDAVLKDRLSDDAVVDTQVHIGSGLTKPVIVDWAEEPARQVRKLHPKATVLFLGINDGQTIQNQAGTFVACCGPDYVDEYTLRARRAMKTYVQGGKGYVYWLAIPAARDPRRVEVISAVNHALVAAAEGMKNVRVLNMVDVFTPGGVYRDSMNYKGRVVKVRQNDGIHLTEAGADIAADYVIAELEKDGVLSQ